MLTLGMDRSLSSCEEQTEQTIFFSSVNRSQENCPFHLFMLFSEGTLDDDILFCSELYLTNIFPQKIVIQCLEFFFFNQKQNDLLNSN